MHWIGKIMMAPFAMIYGLTVSLRNALYDSGMLRSTSFDLQLSQLVISKWVEQAKRQQLNG